MVGVGSTASARRTIRVTEGAIVSIDLCSGAVSTIGSLENYTPVLGGRGLSQALLAERLTPRMDPFDPACPVILAAGLLCGTAVPSAARMSIDSVNPFTGGIGSTNVGGSAAAALRRAGIAALVLVGRSRSAVIVEIDDGQVTLHPASMLAGTRTSDADRALRRQFGNDIATVVIGPAGERLAWPATVVVDGARTAGRCGLGAVLGSKRVKAIAVRGTRAIDVAEPDRFDQAAAVVRETLEGSPFNRRRMEYGVYCYETPWEIESPYRNFSGDAIPKTKLEHLHPDQFLPYLAGKTGCEQCPIQCSTTHAFRDDAGTDWQCIALQGNDPDNFGARLDLDDPRDVLRAHALCNELGLDVDVTSAVIAWAIDCQIAGVLSPSECDDRLLRWGDPGMVFDLIGAIAAREGFGDVLSQGSVRAAARIGRDSERFCRHVRGNDLFECLWTSPAWAFGTVLAPRGGTHTRGAVIEERIAGLPSALAERWYGTDRLPPLGSWTNVERLVIHQERQAAVFDALGVCMFASSGRPDMMLPEDLAELTAAALGRPLSEDELLRTGERIHVQERMINRLLGLRGRDDDYPPQHFIDVALDGQHRIDPEAWETALDRYYAWRGWDTATGWPTREALGHLGLEQLSRWLDETHFESGTESK